MGKNTPTAAKVDLLGGHLVSFATKLQMSLARRTQVKSFLLYVLGVVLKEATFALPG